MSKLIIMQHTINFMVERDPNAVSDMGQNWEAKREIGKDRYFVRQEY